MKSDILKSIPVIIRNTQVEAPIADAIGYFDKQLVIPGAKEDLDNVCVQWRFSPSKGLPDQFVIAVTQREFLERRGGVDGYQVKERFIWQLW